MTSTPSIRKRILHIEDDPGYQEFVETILSKEYTIKTCASVEDALAHLNASEMDLVITDINLLGMTGFEVLERVRRTPHLENCPVVVCSSQSDEDTRQQALKMGAAEFVAKPYDFQTLQALMRRLLA